MDGIPQSGSYTLSQHVFQIFPTVILRCVTPQKAGDSMNIGIVGAGKVGFSFGRLLAEKGVRNIWFPCIPKEEKLKKIALFLNTSVDYLRYGDKTPSYGLNTDIPHTKTTNQEIIEFANRIMSDEDETFRKRFVSALAKAKPEFWDDLERIVDETINKD